MITHIYYFNGIYPVNIETVKVDHFSQDAGRMSRAVDFKFNYMLCLISKEHAAQHRLEHLWTTSKS